MQTLTLPTELWPTNTDRDRLAGVVRLRTIHDFPPDVNGVITTDFKPGVTYVIEGNIDLGLNRIVPRAPWNANTAHVVNLLVR